MKDDENDEEAQRKKEQAERTVYVNRLPPNATEDSIRQIFDEVGEIEDIELPTKYGMHVCMYVCMYFVSMYVCMYVLNIM